MNLPLLGERPRLPSRLEGLGGHRSLLRSKMRFLRRPDGGLGRRSPRLTLTRGPLR